MVDKALDFISKALDTRLKNTFHSDEQHIAIGHVGSNRNETPLILSLLSIEEENVTHNVTFKRDSYNTRPTTLDDHVNLYVVLVVNKTLDYNSGLSLLSSARSCVINRPIYNHQTNSNFPENLSRLTLEVYNLSLDTQSRVWQSLGVSYLPSIVIKIRVISNTEPLITNPKSDTTQSKE
ncbi:Pvc16 family protein [Psychroserpens damuponensis]|uniref:Pvc16 family protein n=1 Tax=Psychroserpens damuponensis TaxID=943936 RepID=UPI000590E086|nr:Pvc16 family protein [Psychroserpens damuponensis]